MAELYSDAVQSFNFTKLPAGIIGIATVYPTALAPTGQEVQVRTTTASLEAGTYMYIISVTVEFNAQNNRVSVRFSLDAGVSWDEFTVEAKDTLEVRPIYYAFPKVEAGGVLDLVVQAKTDAGVNDVVFMDTIIDRKA